MPVRSTADRYDGSGQFSPDGAVGWAGNSRNTIGNGWNTFKFLCGGGNGVLFGVEPDGDLRWYRYFGDGTADRSGHTGWAHSSGNVIANGWQGFKILATAGAVLLGVEQNGDLRWYNYQGDGTADRSGQTGWHPNSRNIIGRGWDRFSRIVGGPDDHYGFGIAL